MAEGADVLAKSGLAVAAFLWFCFPAQASQPPVEAFGSIPASKIARISPDGKYLAVVKPVDGSERVLFLDLTKPNSVPYMVGNAYEMVDDVVWKSSDLAICTFRGGVRLNLGKTIIAVGGAVSVRMSTATVTPLMKNVPYAGYGNPYGAAIVDMLPDDPSHIYVTRFDRRDRQLALDLYKVDLITGDAEFVRHNEPNTIRVLTDGHGNFLGHIEQDGDLERHIFIGPNEVSKYEARGGSQFVLTGFLPAAMPTFAVEKPTKWGTLGLYEWRTTGEVGKALFENPNYDLSGIILDPQTETVIGVTYQDDVTRTEYFDPAMQRVQTSLEHAYPGQTVSILSKDQDGSAYVIHTEGPKNPPVLSLYTPSTHETHIIMEEYPSLKPADLGEMEPYPYKARDGLDIHAYLTLPPGRAPHNLPTVIFPHGGPEARDGMAFNWWTQFMASRGYAVLQPNFRGSAGYGSAFVRAGDGEWAAKVQYDVQDGVQKLIADGIADPKRICIVGASYGGYMALAGATFSPDLYACAVSFAGLSDLDRMLFTGTTFESEAISVWRRRIGADVNSDNPGLQSPANFASRVKIPILLIHGDADSIVPIQQSKIELDALQKAGKNVQMITLKGDDHFLEFSGTRTQMLTSVETFLAAHIGN